MLDGIAEPQKLCYPSDSEQDYYARILGIVYYFYNTKHALRVMLAWFAGKTYEGVDFSKGGWSIKNQPDKRPFKK